LRFKQTFSVPSHRYHAARRMERATNLLLQLTLPVTQLALGVGFRETSSFYECLPQVRQRRAE
jgi:AraC family transcriptional regulator